MKEALTAQAGWTHLWKRVDPTALPARPAEVVEYLHEKFTDLGHGGRVEAFQYCRSRGHLNVNGFSLQAVFDELDLLGTKERRVLRIQRSRRVTGTGSTGLAMWSVVRARSDVRPAYFRNHRVECRSEATCRAASNRA